MAIPLYAVMISRRSCVEVAKAFRLCLCSRAGDFAHAGVRERVSLRKLERQSVQFLRCNSYGVMSVVLWVAT